MDFDVRKAGCSGPASILGDLWREILTCYWKSLLLLGPRTIKAPASAGTEISRAINWSTVRELRGIQTKPRVVQEGGYVEVVKVIGCSKTVGNTDCPCEINAFRIVTIE